MVAYVQARIDQLNATLPYPVGTVVNVDKDDPVIHSLFVTRRISQVGVAEGTPPVAHPVLASALGPNPMAGVMTALSNDKSTSLTIAGDSTGDNKTGLGAFTAEWTWVLGQLIGEDFPGHNVWIRPWNDTNQSYDPPTVIQSGPSGARYVQMTAGQLSWSAPSITGNLQVSAKLRPTTWATPGWQAVASKWGAAGSRGWWWILDDVGKMQFWWSPGGTAAFTATSSVAVPFANNTDGWIRASFVASTGVVTFYTSTDGVTWTQLGTPSTATGATAIFDNSAQRYQIGSWDAGLSPQAPLAGRLYWVEITKGVNGEIVGPCLPELWDQTSGDTTISYGGSPTLVMYNASVGGQAISYFDDSTRRPKVFARIGQAAVIVSLGHNQQVTTGGWGQPFIAAADTFLTNVQTNVGKLPVGWITQNRVNPLVVGANGEAYRALRSAALMAFLAGRGGGVYGLDTYPAITDVTNQVDPDGVHLVAAGSRAQGQYVHDAWFAPIYSG